MRAIQPEPRELVSHWATDLPETAGCSSLHTNLTAFNHIILFCCHATFTCRAHTD